MAQQNINIGAEPNDGTGDNLRVAGGKINDNFTELYEAVAAAAPFTVGCFFTTTPTSSEVLLRYSFAEAVNFAGNFAGAVGKIATNPTGALVLAAARNGAPIGTVTISVAGNFTFTTTGGDAMSFNAGDDITITAPATADATAAGASFTLKGARA